MIKHTAGAIKIMSNPTKPYMIVICNEDALLVSVECRKHAHEALETTMTK